MQNNLLQLDSSSIQNSFNSTVNTLIEQVTPELPHTSFVTDLAFYHDNWFYYYTCIF